MKPFGHLSDRVWIFPIESRPLEPGDSTAFVCALEGACTGDAYAHLWMPRETRDAFVIDAVDRGPDRLRIALSCVAERPTAFRGWLYLVFLWPEPAAPELLS
jgi:hypothetical protein